MIVRTLVAGALMAGLFSAAPLFVGSAFAGEEAASVPTPTITKLDLKTGQTYATLAKPLKSPKDPVIDGRIWHCEGDTCRVSPLPTAHAQAVGRECATAAHQIGAFAFYQTGGEVVDGDALAKCNAQAR